MSDAVMYALKGDSTGAVAAFKDVEAAIKRSEDRIDKLSAALGTMQKESKKAVEQAYQIGRYSEASARGIAEQSKGISGLISRMTGAGKASSELNKGLSDVNSVLSDSGVEIPRAEMAIKMLTNPVVLLTAATLGASIAIGKFALENADLVEHLSNLEATTGITIDQLYSIRDIAMASGVEFDAVTKAVSKMETELGKGNKELKELGLTGGNSVEDIARVAEAWNKAATTAEKNRIAMAAFGKGFQDMIPLLQQGGDAIRALGDAKQIDVQKYRELDETADGISQAWRDIKFAIGDIAAGPLDVLLSGFKGILNITRDTAEGWDALLSRKGGPNAGVAEAFLAKYAVKTGGVPDPIPGNPGNKKIVTSVAENVDQLKADFAGLSVQERLRILDGLYNLDKSTASTTMRSLFSTNGQINGLPIADLANMTKTASADSKETTPPETDEARATKEIEFQRRVIEEVAILTASSDQRDMLRIQQKYEKLRAEHAGYIDSLKLIDSQYYSEMQNYSMNKNFADLAVQRDADQAAGEQIDSSNKRRFQKGWGSNDRARLARKMQGAGLIEENGVGVYDATQMSIKEMQEALDNYRAAIDPALSASNQAALEMGNAWASVTDSIAGDMSSRFVAAFAEMRKGTMDLSDALGSVLMGSLDSVLSKVVELGLQYGLMAGFTALLGPAGGAVMGGGTAATGGAAAGGGLGFFDFILKGLSGHADGTLSSPGGLKFLGERGTEGFETPYGQRGSAAFGLYYVPAGTRVTPSTATGNSVEKHYHLHTTESDPIQVGEQFRRIVREEMSGYDSERYRQRS